MRSAALVLGLAAAACLGPPSAAAGDDPCAVEQAAKDAAVAALTVDLGREHAARRQIPFLEREISHWDARSVGLQARSDALALRADALQPRIDAAPVGSPRQLALLKRQAALRELSDAWADEAFQALVRADSVEAALLQARQERDFALGDIADDRLVLGEARAALAACRDLRPT